MCICTYYNVHITLLSQHVQIINQIDCIYYVVARICIANLPHQIQRLRRLYHVITEQMHIQNVMHACMYCYLLFADDAAAAAGGWLVCCGLAPGLRPLYSLDVSEDIPVIAQPAQLELWAPVLPLRTSFSIIELHIHVYEHLYYTLLNSEIWYLIYQWSWLISTFGHLFNMNLWTHNDRLCFMLHKLVSLRKYLHVAVTTTCKLYTTEHVHSAMLTLNRIFTQ